LEASLGRYRNLGPLVLSKTACRAQRKIEHTHAGALNDQLSAGKGTPRVLRDE
jgi:hypothetical protein